MPGALIGVTPRGVIGRGNPPTPAGRTMPGGPRGRTGWPGAAALGLTEGRLPGPLPPAAELLALRYSSEQRVSGSRLPSMIEFLTSA